MGFQYTAPRSEMLDFLPSTARVVLDVGCGAGSFGEALRASGRGLETWAVEPDEVAVQTAADRYDHLVHGTFPAPELPTGHFDAVYCNDVLEHMVDPESVLPELARVLRPDGVVIASIPNVRHVTALWPLLRHGDWTYTDQGLLDRTHLRFFTRSTAAGLFAGQGWTVRSVTGVNRRVRLDEGDRHLLRVLGKLTGGRSSDFFYLQYVVIAGPPTSAG